MRRRRASLLYLRRAVVQGMGHAQINRQRNSGKPAWTTRRLRAGGSTAKCFLAPYFACFMHIALHCIALHAGGRRHPALGGHPEGG